VALAYGWVKRVLSMVKQAHIFHILTSRDVVFREMKDVVKQEILPSKE
jgi:hypothetical protein